MGQFVVSARKYRPQRFDEVVGQEHVTKTLKNALENDQLAHAFLFCGPRGVGKTTCARILAKVLNCENRTEDFESCNECSSCVSFSENASFNINELDAASNNSVEHIRALIEQVRFQPQQGQYKVFIIDEVHMLSQQAFNAFLKTLEEPPPYAVFILATTEKHKIIPTILSRCQIFDFKRIPVLGIVDHLDSICSNEGIQADRDALHVIATKADGALRDALSIFDRISSFAGKKITYQSVIENLNVLDYDYFFRVVDAMLIEDSASVLLIFNEVFKKGFDADLFLEGLAEHLRNLLVCKDAQTLELLDTSESLKKRYADQAKIAQPGFLLTALNIIVDCDAQYKMARNKRLHVELALIKMTFISRAVEINRSATPTLSQEKKTLDLSREQNTYAVDHKHQQQATDSSNKEKDKGVSKEHSVDPLKHKQERSDKGAEIVKEQQVQTEHKQEITEKKSLKRKKSKFDIPSLEIMEEDERNQPDPENKPLSLEPDLLGKTWTAYIETISSPSVKTAFSRAVIKIKDETTIVVEVGSQMAKNMIQQEKNLLLFIRDRIPVKNLGLETIIDPELVKDLIVTKKILTPKEKYELMREKNPMVHELRLRLDLKPDHQFSGE